MGHQYSLTSIVYLRSYFRSHELQLLLDRLKFSLWRIRINPHISYFTIITVAHCSISISYKLLPSLYRFQTPMRSIERAIQVKDLLLTVTPQEAKEEELVQVSCSVLSDKVIQDVFKTTGTLPCYDNFCYNCNYRQKRYLH